MVTTGREQVLKGSMLKRRLKGRMLKSGISAQGAYSGIAAQKDGEFGIAAQGWSDRDSCTRMERSRYLLKDGVFGKFGEEGQ